MTMATKKTKKPEVTVTISAPAAGAPAKLLANAELLFATGLLAGLRLTGIALWKATAADGRRFVSVTFPARSVEDDGETRYFDHVRGKGEDVKRLKAAIVDAFREYAREAAIEVPEDQAARRKRGRSVRAVRGDSAVRTPTRGNTRRRRSQQPRPLGRTANAVRGIAMEET